MYRDVYFMITRELHVKNIQRQGKRHAAQCLCDGSITGSRMWETGGLCMSFARKLSSSSDL